MKRLYIGIVLLAVLLVLGIVLTVSFAALHNPLSDRLLQASRIAGDDLHQAAALAGEAKLQWDQWRRFTAAVSDHRSLEQIDAQFARVAVFARLDQPAEFAATCAELSRLLSAMADSQQVTWWDLL